MDAEGAPQPDPRIFERTPLGTFKYAQFLRDAWMREHSAKKFRWELAQLEGEAGKHATAAAFNLYLLAGVAGVAIVAVLILRR